jgi:hypothetical protein
LKKMQSFKNLYKNEVPNGQTIVAKVREVHSTLTVRSERRGNASCVRSECCAFTARRLLGSSFRSSSLRM